MSSDRQPGRGNLTSIAKVFSGAVAGQAILAGCSPLLTRLYSPTEIGAYGLCLSLSLILAPLTSLRIEYAIPIARRDVEARAVLFTTMFCNVTFLIVAALLLSAIEPFVKLTSRAQSFAGVRYYVLFSTCFLSIFESFRFYCVRNREYALVGRMLVSRSIWQAGIQLGAPYASLGGQGMLIGYVVGQFLGTRRLLKSLLSSANGTRHRFFSRRYISRVVWRHRRFPFMMMPSNLINSIGFYMPNVLVTYYYGIEAGGFYTLAQSMIVVHRQRTLLIWDMCRTPILLACIVAIARHGGSVNTALVTYSSVTGAFYLLLLLLIVVTLRRELVDHDLGGRKDLVASSVDG